MISGGGGCVDDETEVITCSRELVCPGLNLLLGGDTEGTAVGKHKVSDGCPFYLGDCSQATLVE